MTDPKPETAQAAAPGPDVEAAAKGTGVTLTMDQVQRGLEAALDVLQHGDAVRAKYHKGKELYIGERVLGLILGGQLRLVAPPAVIPPNRKQRRVAASKSRRGSKRPV